MILGTLASFGARAINLLSALISVPLTYRYLGAERYGIWMVLVSFITAMGIADLGIGTGVVKGISEANGKDDRELMREYASSGFVLMLCVGLLIASAGIAAYPHLPWMRIFNVKSPAAATEGARASLVLFGWFAINIPLGVVTRIQTGLQRMYWSQTLNACGSALSLLALLVVIALHGNLAWLVFVTTSGTIVSTIGNGWILFRNEPWLLPSLRAYRNGTAAKIMHLGFLFFVMQVAAVVGFTSDNVVISQVLGVAAVAVYAVPQKLFGFLSQLIIMGAQPIFPAYGEAISRGDFKWVRRAFRNSLAATMGLALTVCPLLAIFAPWIIRILVGKTLHVPIPLLWVLAVWGIVLAAWVPTSILIQGGGNLKIQTTATAIASVVNLALSIYLTRRVGVMGVCLGSIIAQVTIIGPVSFYLIRKLFNDMTDGSIGRESQPASPVLSVE
jgi:O-antigen/teichoic acid export membrane protein